MAVIVISTLTILRSLEDTMNFGSLGFRAWMTDVHGNSSRYYAMNNAGSSCPGGSIVKSESIKPESLILAQSERWRQA
jgi:hypothetical protein